MSGLTNFKQAASVDHGSVMASHFVLLQVTTEINGQTKIVFVNTLCNSSISCRPLRYWYVIGIFYLIDCFDFLVFSKTKNLIFSSIKKIKKISKNLN